MTKFLCVVLLALLSISMVANQVLAKESSEHNLESNAQENAQEDAAKHNTINLACSSAKNAATSAYVFLLAIMATKLYAPATTTGRPRKEDPSALEPFYYIYFS
ncbi:hypothetical protein F8388_026454 [Cannabis sativa]|uniref:Uncharacterized protein n=1 Tax=Cannabis sativa TaxID=3483 RepID=A0A7J6I922_CANSA|nr:hypothetical protein F8388_026454 [Cannabis sativa]KAF4403170.1 hypothetical protein G4B88_027941 [Cannabis sativa]